MTATQDMLVPSFDDEVETGRKLAIIISKGSLDMAYPGLILGNAALGEGVEVELFFTFWGFDIITKGRMEHLKFSPVGNPAAHIPAALAPIPGMTSIIALMLLVFYIAAVMATKLFGSAFPTGSARSGRRPIRCSRS